MLQTMKINFDERAYRRLLDDRREDRRRGCEVP